MALAANLLLKSIGCIFVILICIAVLLVARSSSDVKSQRPHELPWHEVFANITRHHKDDMSALAQLLVTPMMGYFLCDFYLGDEPSIPEYWGRLPPPRAAPFANTTRISAFQSLYVQHAYFQYFVQNCLPRLDAPVVLMTGQWHLPSLTWSNELVVALESPKIAAWCMQNPLIDHWKVVPIPYGLLHHQLSAYAAAVGQAAPKDQHGLAHLHVSPTHPSRARFNNICTGPSKIACYKGWLHADDYYNIARLHKFMFSPVGDRPDTYRHWELIGLGVVPISNCPAHYVKLFKGNMIFVRDGQIEDFARLTNDSLAKISLRVDRRLVLMAFWKRLLQRQISDVIGITWRGFRKIK
jgi:hypothetical protein